MLFLHLFPESGKVYSYEKDKFPDAPPGICRMWDKPYLVDPRKTPRSDFLKTGLAGYLQRSGATVDPRSLEVPQFFLHHKTDTKRLSRPLAVGRRSSYLYAIPSPKTVLVIIDNRLVSLISSHLSQYIADLELDGWTVVSLVYVSGDIWDIKDEIVAVHENPLLPPLDGVVLIGRIPVPRYYSKGPGSPHWNGYCNYPNAGWPIPPSIVTFFYGNLKEYNGYYPNGTNLVYHVKPPGVDNWSPDIWVSIIRGNWLPILGGGVEFNEDTDIEAGKINGYFEKNHRVRSGIVPRYKTGLSVSAFGDEQATAFQQFLEDLTGGTVDKYVQSSMPSAAWTGNYDWACFASHGGPTGFLSVTAQNFYNNVCNIKFVNVSACKCGNLDYGESALGDCVAQGMVMDPEGDIVTTFSGSDYNGGMGGIDEFIISIASGNTIGKAYADWEKNTWARWNAHSGDGEHGITWPIERFASITFGDGTFYYAYGAPLSPTPTPTPEGYRTPTPSPTVTPTPEDYHTPTPSPSPEGYHTPTPTLTPTPTSIPTCSPVPPPPDGWFADWEYREKITISAAEVESDLVGFPVLISLDPVQSQVFGSAQSDGEDILFAPGDRSSKWYHEIEEFNPQTGSGELVAWVRVPHLSSRTDTIFYMYYGNPGASDQQEREGVWDSHFKGVWHLGEGGGSTVNDATAEGNDGTAGKGTGWTTAGKVNGAYDCDGSSDYFTVPDAAAIKPDRITLEAWISSAEIPFAVGYPGLYDTMYSYAYSFMGKDGDELSAYFHIDGSLKVLTTSGADLGEDTWYHAAARYDGSKISIFINGEERASLSAPGDLDTGGDFDLLLGHGRGGVSYWKGALDELRLSDSARSDDWILACYRNQSSPDNFYSVAPGEGSLTPTPAPTATSTPTPSLTPRPSLTPTPMPTSSLTPAPSRTPTVNPSPSLTPSITPTLSVTPTPRITLTPSPTVKSQSRHYDYDGDGTSDIGIYRGKIGLWAIRGVTRVYFGGSSDIPVPGDYDGDGTTDIGIFRSSSGLWVLRNISRIYFGQADDLPFQGDFDGSGTWTVGVFRPFSGLWAIRGVTRLYFGGATDTIAINDYNGDGVIDIGIFRPGSGLWALSNVSRTYFGGVADLPTPGDYEGDGTSGIAIFREANGLWAIRSLTRIYYGTMGDWPCVADFDGDITDDIGIFRDGLWAVRGITRVYFGLPTDLPVSR